MIYDIATLYSWHQSYYISPLTDYIWKHIHCISVITPRLWIIQCHCTYGNTATICMTSYELHVTSRPFFMISHHVMISHPLYSCHQTQDTCHRMHCFWMITYSVLIVPLYQTKPQYLGCHIHFRHDITPPVSDIASTVSLSSKPLHCYHTHFWMTSHPPSVWHHMHYIEHHIQSLCHHSTVLMTSQPLYMKPHPVCRATYTLYMRHHSLYLSPDTQSIDNITPTLCMTSHSPNVWHCLPYTRHHILNLWPQTTVFMSSHPLYLTSCPLYLCHHIHCIDDITPTVFLRSLQL